MKITFIDIHNPNGGAPVTRSYEVDKLINAAVPTFLPDLRAHGFLTEMRKVLLYSRFDACFLPWEERRLSNLELRLGKIDVEARFQYRWCAPKTITAEVAVKAVEQAMAKGRKELKFYINWFPFTTAHNTLVALGLVEEGVSQCLEQLAEQAHEAKECFKKLARRLPRERGGCKEKTEAAVVGRKPSWPRGRFQTGGDWVVYP